MTWLVDITQGKSTSFDRLLDGVASKLGTCVLIGLFLGVCAGSGVFLEGMVTRLEENQTAFRDRQLRNGYVAMSDIQRLVLIAQRAVHEGEMSPPLAIKFVNATDVLYVRNEAFRHSMKDEARMESGVVAIAAIDRVIEIADEAIEGGFSQNYALVGTLLSAGDGARSKLVRFLDDMRRNADEVLESQTLAVEKQQSVVLIVLAGLALVGIAAVLLLRREVLGRRARERAEQRVEFLAYFDPLTRLPNRTQHQERLAAALADGRPVALLYVDLDDFKIINDTHGHLAGDAVLVHVAGILSELAKDYRGVAARLGGDEFALLVPGDDLARLEALCQKALDRTATPFLHEGETLDIGLSIGLATSTQVGQRDTVTPDMLSRVSDFALYASKTAGRRRYTVYDRELEKLFQERRDLLDELPVAIAAGDLAVFLQSKVTLPEGRPYGFEALVRWPRAGRLVPPDQFIQIAEESGLVTDIDTFVLGRATRLVADWNKAQGTAFSISVNLSAVHFTSRRIVETVQDALWTSGLDPALLTLEITETMQMRDWNQARSIVSALRGLGCRISIDDFGTGYSSLAYLRTTAADEVKIDRTLIQEVTSVEKARLLLASVLEIARNLEFEVVVEGIETEGQAAIVHNMGARLAQGFLFGRPQTAESALQDATARCSSAPATLAGPAGNRASP